MLWKMNDESSRLGTTSSMILGLVSRHPSSGYDVAARAARSIANFWPVSRSQVYAELSRLEAAGLIQGTHVEQDRRPDKRRYELTGAGAEALDAWVRAPDYPAERTRSGMLAKFFFAEHMTAEQRVSMLTEYRDRADAYRLELQAVVDKLADKPASLYARSTALFGLLTTEARISWADHMLAVLGGSVEFGEIESGTPTR
jgi:DNA-binding PadR family transcriptional regulator